MLIVLCTTPDREEAERLAEHIVTAKLAGCVQILPKLTSIYSWEGKVRKDDEYLMMIKTLPEKYVEIEAYLSDIHSYDVPEILAINADHTSADYRRWLEEYLSS